jgi:predicted TIM-barrel fold metal-dependent hydrolase
VEPLYGEASLPELERMKRQLNMDGVMFHHRFQGAFIDNWVMRPYLRKMRELGLIPFIHIMAGSEMENVWRLHSLAEEFPDVTFVALDSLSSFYQLEEIIRISKRTPNIYWDTACLWQGPFTVARFVHHVGPDRLLFASDLYGTKTGHSPAENLSAVLTADISEADKSKILWENAMRLFRLQNG